jgi:hypothetical protein
MRARRLAVALDEPPPDFVDDVVVRDEVPFEQEDAPPLDRLCIVCGGEGSAHDGCDHPEIARLDAPSRAIVDAVARLRRASAEHRAASRALRVLVLGEVARGRGDLESRPEAKPEPCPKCLVREAQEAVAATGPKPKRRSKGGEGQQALPFGAIETLDPQTAS